MGLGMHTQSKHSPAAAAAGSENALDMWERLCGMWDAALQRAQKTGDSSQVARAELTLGMCERERSRVEALFRVGTP
jgi:hypothetical protein